MTGASGFIGQAVVVALRASGQDVVAVARHAGNGFRSVRDYAELAPASVEDALIHLAETRDVASAEAQGEAHVARSQERFAALLGKGWSHVVYASSAAVYGDAVDRPRRPNEEVAPRGAYAKAKRACEVLAVESGGTAARIANVYGPGMSRTSVLGDILAQIPGSGAVRVREVAPVRDFIWIADAAAGLAALALSRSRAIYNIGSGEGVSIGDLAGAVLRAAGEGYRQVEAAAPSGRSSYLVLDIGETIKHTGWRPTTSLMQGLAELVGAPQ